MSGQPTPFGVLRLSQYVPSFHGTDRWLRRGIPIDSTKLGDELDDIATAVNSANIDNTIDKTDDLTFYPSFGVKYSREERATGKFGHAIWSQVDEDLISIDIGATTGIAQSDTAFNIIGLDTGSTGFGSKWLHLGLNFYFATSSPAARHPAHATYTSDLGFVIREASNFSTVNLGNHPLGIAADTDFPTADTGVHYRSVVIRNIDQSFAIRIGTGLTIGAGSRLLVRMSGLHY